MRTLLPLLFLSLAFLACESKQSGDISSSEVPVANAQTIVDRAIEVHGGERFENLEMAFRFRDREYTAKREDGQYTYTRAFTDTLGQVKDVLTNSGFSRTINGKRQSLPAERVKAFTASVNSVIYFALLPFGLNDPAVQKQLLGTVTIKGIPYHKIKVTFKQDGGGEDFQDEFLYWMNQEKGTMDYLAYTYATEGGGIRFRKAINPKVIQGIRFQDYINYEPAGNNFLEIEKDFEAGNLKELSRIELQDIKVRAR
ncbi:hypothetical protein TH63_17045 [Rufibacter radiotolerans]|uniref:Deoxyribose-phosphate aldolase n=1 Tax=Rufibacter radiotolerans TaxID=1379910 RepID=A0A0H4VT30_9BACT|nr:DUF6503 family protein [Rufibacter radiotolerans]AKQ46959.1 hypothetical protein TH63_17045 [Rufibacter radiotolerans]